MTDDSDDSLDDTVESIEPPAAVVEPDLATDDYDSTFSDASVATANAIQPSANKIHITKWQKLKKYYSDQYLDLFTITYEKISDVNSNKVFEATQIGAVPWCSQEKERFFTALDRYGRHDLPKLAKAVGTKSMIEVKDFIDCLQNAYLDRQLFDRKTNNVSHAEIPAAVEIGEGCEAILDRAADAVLAYQEKYDVEAGQQKENQPWLIHRGLATELDAAANEGEDNPEDLANDNDPSDKSARMFNLITMLDLSEKFFMNQHTRSAHKHWSKLVESDQRPATTTEVLNDLHDLVVSLTQRILQVALFQAQTRIRASTRSGHMPAKLLVTSDVRAALDILGMKHDSWDFWTCFARRNNLDIVLGSHELGVSENQPVSYEDAEELLTIRQSRGRRRSMSVGASHSPGVTLPAEHPPNEAGSESEISYSPTTDKSTSDDGDLISDEDDSLELSEREDITAFSPTSNFSSNKSLSKAEKITLREDAMDDYMELLDQKARLQEEGVLQRVLRQQADMLVKEEDENDPPIRPKTFRKSREEVQGWKCEYRSEWEQLGKVLSTDDFLGSISGRKRKAEEEPE